MCLKDRRIVFLYFFIFGLARSYDDNYDFVFEIKEESPPGTLVGELIEYQNTRTGIYPNDYSPFSDLYQNKHESTEKVYLNTYKLADTSQSSYFKLDEARLTVNQRIDREEICAQERQHRDSEDSDVCFVTLTLVESERSILIKHVLVKIIDINDNSPFFKDNQVILEINENAPINTKLYLPMAFDADKGLNNIQEYRFMSGEEDDQIEPTFILSQGEDQDFTEMNMHRISFRDFPSINLEPKLIVSRPLDREQKERYTGWLIAIDGGSPSRSGSLEIAIQVIDVNDNSPLFDKFSYTLTVQEDLPVGSVVLNVSATDADTGNNARITYSIQGSNEYFHIEPDSGIVYLAKSLDYERKQVHSLVVSAKDSGSGAVPVLAKATIHVSDTNDNEPKMKFGNFPVRVQENKEPGIFVVHFSVEDKDKGDNGRVFCWLEDDLAFELKQHQANIYMYTLVSKISLDREQEEHYRIKIICKDHGWPVLERSEYIEILVEDENDNAPHFSKNISYINISESTSIGSKLVKIQADDADKDMNGEISYSFKVSNYENNPRRDLSEKSLLPIENKNLSSNDLMTGTLHEWFHLNSATGLLTVKNEIDFEKVTKVHLQITARDKGTPEARSSSTFLIVSIFDINDEPPIFSSKAFSFGITENQSPGSEIGHVTASDLDSPPYDKFTFAIVEPRHFHDKSSNQYEHEKQERKNYFDNGFDASKTKSSRLYNERNLNYDKHYSMHHHKHQSINPHDWFTIDENSGRISTVRILDREQHSVYRFWVTATNTIHPFFVASAEVTVSVADENDNPPIIFFPPSDNYPFHIPIYAGKNFQVTKVIASDADVGDNEKLSYSIVKGNDDELFEINSESGEVLVAKDEAFTSNEITRSYTRNADSSDLDSIHKLLILVKDFGIPQKTAIINIEIYINKSIQFRSGLSNLDHDSDSFSFIFSNITFDFSSFTGKYVLFLIAIVSFILVVVIILVAIFTRRFFLRRRKKQTLVMLKKSSLNNTSTIPNNQNNVSSLKFSKQFSGPKVQNNLYATVKPNALKNATTSSSSTNDINKFDPIDRNSPYFKSIDISNDINDFVFQDNKFSNTPNSHGTYITNVNSTSSNNNFYNSPRLASININGMSTFQPQKTKMFCHEEALSHLPNQPKEAAKGAFCEKPVWSPQGKKEESVEVGKLLEQLKVQKTDSSFMSHTLTDNLCRIDI